MTTLETFEPVVVERHSLPRQIAERLRKLIIDGRLHPGDRLPGERELAEQLNVARTSLREAVRLLEAAGLLVVRRGRGVFVAETDPGDHFHEILQHFSSPSVEPRQIAELNQVRRVLETEAAGWAAPGIDRESLAHLKRLCHEAQAVLADKPPDFDRLQKLDTEFHNTIIRSTGNAVLVRIMDSLLDLLTESRRFSVRRPGRGTRSWTEHRRITAALARHDVEEARQLMLRHVVGVEKSTFSRARSGAGK